VRAAPLRALTGGSAPDRVAAAVRLRLFGIDGATGSSGWAGPESGAGAVTRRRERGRGLGL